MSRVIFQGSKVEGKKSRVEGKKSRATEKFESFLKVRILFNKSFGLSFAKAKLLFLLPAMLKNCPYQSAHNTR